MVTRRGNISATCSINKANLCPVLLPAVKQSSYLWLSVKSDKTTRAIAATAAGRRPTPSLFTLCEPSARTLVTPRSGKLSHLPEQHDNNELPSSLCAKGRSAKCSLSIIHPPSDQRTRPRPTRPKLLFHPKTRVNVGTRSVVFSYDGKVNHTLALGFVTTLISVELSREKHSAPVEGESLDIWIHLML